MFVLVLLLFGTRISRWGRGRLGIPFAIDDKIPHSIRFGRFFATTQPSKINHFEKGIGNPSSPAAFFWVFVGRVVVVVGNRSSRRSARRRRWFGNGLVLLGVVHNNNWNSRHDDDDDDTDNETAAVRDSLVLPELVRCSCFVLVVVVVVVVCCL